jgi:predicted transposase YbfD/YdcC
LKDNQPSIRAKAEQLLTPLLQGPCQFQTTTNHGDRVETHQIWCLSVIPEQIGFPAARQIFAIRRIVEPKNNVTKGSDDISYGIASLPFYETLSKNAETVLTIRRKHWGIESKSHYSRDKTYQEDSCQVRNHRAARTLVAFRQLAIFLAANDAHAPLSQRDRCLPEFNRFCLFNRDQALKWVMRPRGFRA